MKALARKRLLAEPAGLELLDTATIDQERDELWTPLSKIGGYNIFDRPSFYIDAKKRVFAIVDGGYWWVEKINGLSASDFGFSVPENVA